jgi:hypothetical protein
MSMMRTATGGFKEFAESLKSPGGVLATRGESRAEAAGHAARGIVEGAAVGLLTGVADGLLPGGATPKQLGVASIVAGGLAVATSSTKLGRSFSNAAVGLAAIAAHSHAGPRAAHAGGGGKVSAFLSNKAKAVAAHGEADVAGELAGLDAGEDPLIAEGSRLFGT